MDVGVYPYSHGDPLLIDKIVNEFLSQGKFDKLRKECMSDADTKPAYQNLQQRVENTVTQFLKKQVWRPDLNKNQLRDTLRKHILDSKFFDAGINRIVDQVVNPNVLATVFLPEVEEVVYNYLSIPRPFDKPPKRDDRVRSSGRDYEHRGSHESKKYGKDKEESDNHKRENHYGEEDYKQKDIIEKKVPKDYENELVKAEPPDEPKRTEKEKIKTEAEEESNQSRTPVEKIELPSDESQESLNRMAVEGLNLNEPVPDSDDSVPLEINEKSMSESRDSEDSIMNQMSPISQGRLTPELEEEPKREMKVEEKKPLTFIGRIPKIKREDSDSSKSSKTREDTPRKPEGKTNYSSDESDSSKSYGKSDSDEKRKRGEKKEEKKRDEAEKKDKKRENSSKSSKHKRERSRERHKKTSTSSSSSQRERSSSHHKSSHRHKDSKSRRKEEEKKKSKSADDHGKERNKKEDRRSTDRDSNERERGRSTGSRAEGKREQPKNEETKEERSQNEVEKEEKPKEGKETGQKDDVLNFNELFQMGALTVLQFPKVPDDFYVKFNSTGFRYFEEWEKAKLDCEEEFKEFVDEAEKDLSLLSDDDSDLGEDFSEENSETVRNLLRGIGNFRRSLMFDPSASQFYKWTNSRQYLKFRKKDTEETRESDESIKENIERGERKRALYLKLISRYRRKAIRTGKPRRRPRIKGGIKEKNDNSYGEQVENTYLKTEVPSYGGLYGSEGVSLPESPEENEDWSPPVSEKDERGKRESLTLHLPPSPDSDDVNNTGNGFVLVPKQNGTVPKKRANKTREDGGTPKKTKRNYSQKYESQDLYKPRPILNGSRTRGRERGMERSDSPVLR